MYPFVYIYIYICMLLVQIYTYEYLPVNYDRSGCIYVIDFIYLMP